MSNFIETPVPEILNTNDPPSDAQLSRIQDYLPKQDSKIVLLNTKIAELQAALDKVTQKRDDLVESYQAHKALTSSLRRFPADILAEIFLYCCIHDGPYSYPTPLVVEAPLLLCRICSRWRNIAVSTPALWCKILLSAEYGQSQAVPEWMTWLGARPFCAQMFTHPYLNHTTVFEPIIPYLDRCRELMLKMHHFSWLETFSVPPLQALEDIFIDTYDSGWGVEATLPLLSPLLEAAPRLQRISWYGRVSIHTIRFNSTKLTSLRHWSVSSMPDLVDVVALCPHLTELYVIDCHPVVSGDAWPVFSRSPVTLSELRFLRMSVELDVAGMFNHLITPSLTQLCIETWSAVPHRWPESSLVSFLTHAGTMLETLTIKVWSMSEDTVLKCLPLLPSLTELFCKLEPYQWDPDYMITDRTIEALTRRGEADDVLPKLKIFRLHKHFCVTDAALVAMIKSRCQLESNRPILNLSPESPPKAILKVMDVDLRHTLAKDLAASLLICRNQGLDIIGWETILGALGSN